MDLELINVIVNNGLGIGSFIAMIIFIFKYQNTTNETLNKINDSQIAMTTTLSDLSNRVTNIETEIRGK